MDAMTMVGTNYDGDLIVEKHKNCSWEELEELHIEFRMKHGPLQQFIAFDEKQLSELKRKLR